MSKKNKKVTKISKSKRYVSKSEKQPQGSQDRKCSIKGCGTKSRSKGFCSRHYQQRMLMIHAKTLPSTWKDNAKPGSIVVKDESKTKKAA